MALNPIPPRGERADPDRHTGESSRGRPASPDTANRWSAIVLLAALAIIVAVLVLA